MNHDWNMYEKYISVYIYMDKRGRTTKKRSPTTKKNSTKSKSPKQKSEKKKTSPPKEDCSICFETIKEGDATTKCSNSHPHVFHRQCIIGYCQHGNISAMVNGRLENVFNCPECRAQSVCPGGNANATTNADRRVNREIHFLPGLPEHIKNGAIRNFFLIAVENELTPAVSSRIFYEAENTSGSPNDRFEPETYKMTYREFCDHQWIHNGYELTDEEKEEIKSKIGDNLIYASGDDFKTWVDAKYKMHIGTNSLDTYLDAIWHLYGPGGEGLLRPRETLNTTGGSSKKYRPHKRKTKRKISK